MSSSKEACEFVSQNIITKLLGIGGGADMFKKASVDEGGQTLEYMQKLLLNFIAKVFCGVKWKQWLLTSDISSIISILRYLGFDPDPEKFNLETSSRDCLIAFGYLIWRLDLFSKLYADYLPPENSYTSPYGTVTDELNIPVKNQPNMPKNVEDLAKLLNRQINRITRKLHSLSDIEYDIDYYKALIMNLDKESTVYELRLKANPDLMKEHISSLKQANSKSDIVMNIARNEARFYKFLSQVLKYKQENWGNSSEEDPFEVDFFPDVSMSPVRRLNTQAKSIQDKFQNIEKMFVLLDKKFDADLISLSAEEKKAINNEVGELKNKLLRLDHVEPKKEEEKRTFIVPDFNFSSFSEQKLHDIVNKYDSEAARLEQASISEIDSRINALCQKFNLKYTGLKLQNESLSFI